MQFDIKEQVIINHYKHVIENRLFDEYDILGFLIFIREKLDKGNYSLIPEFSDLIAHRHRNKGIVMDNIKNAIQNNYQRNNNKVKGYVGIKWETWTKEWKNISSEFNIVVDRNILREITICIFSLSQNTNYDDRNGNVGKIELFLDEKSSSLCLCITEGDYDSFYVCFAKCDNLKIKNNMFNAGHIKEAVETKRCNKKLILKYSKGIILEV